MYSAEQARKDLAKEKAKVKKWPISARWQLKRIEKMIKRKVKRGGCAIRYDSTIDPIVKSELEQNGYVILEVGTSTVLWTYVRW